MNADVVLTKDLAVKIEQAEIAALYSRLAAIKEINGNPMGVDIKQFGKTTAFSVKNIPGPSFNTVKGISGKDVMYIEEIIDFYRKKGIPARFDVTPAHATPELFARLSKQGFCQSDFHTALYGSANDFIETSNPLIAIRKLEKNEFDTFADIYTTGFGMPSFTKEGIAKNNEILHDNDSWTFYLVSIDNIPAGIGVLFVNNGIGQLAASTTVSSFRNKGVQSALINERLNEASHLNCALFVGQAKYGSVSQNNMERAGMKVAYTKAVWGERHSTDK